VKGETNNVENEEKRKESKYKYEEIEKKGRGTQKGRKLIKKVEKKHSLTQSSLHTRNSVAQDDTKEFPIRAIGSYATSVKYYRRVNRCI
jgi:hypothetical protein